MKSKVGDGSLSKWFAKANDQELLFLAAMSPGAIDRLCMLITLEQQILKEKG